MAAASKAKVARKNVVALGFVSLFMDVSSEMTFPILPLFLANVLKAPFAAIGLIEGVAQAAIAFLSMYSGWLSDKLRVRKKLVLAGYVLATAVKPLLPLANSWPVVLFVRAADRAGKGLRDAPRDALVAEVGKKKRGGAFGIQRALDSTGAVIGTLITAYLLSLAFDFRSIFWLATVPPIVSLLILYLFVKEIRPRKAKRLRLRVSALTPQMKKFLIVVATFGLAKMTFAWPILRAQELGVPLVMIPIVFLVYNIFYAALSYPAGRLSDRIGRRAALAIGLVTNAVASLGFALAPSAIFAWLLFGLWGVQLAFTDAVPRAYAADLVPQAKRGTALGMYQATMGITTLTAGIIIGVLWQMFGSFAAFAYTALFDVFAILLLFALMRR